MSETTNTKRKQQIHLTKIQAQCVVKLCAIQISAKKCLTKKLEFRRQKKLVSKFVDFWHRDSSIAKNEFGAEMCSNGHSNQCLCHKIKIQDMEDDFQNGHRIRKFWKSNVKPVAPLIMLVNEACMGGNGTYIALPEFGPVIRWDFLSQQRRRSVFKMPGGSVKFNWKTKELFDLTFMI